MSVASLVYLAITAATAGFTGCAFGVEFIERKRTAILWGSLCAAACGACAFFIVSKTQ